MTEPSPAENPIDLPTGEPIPVPTPAAPAPPPSSSSPSSPSSFPSAKPLAARAASLPRGADAFLAHLQRCLATPGGVDTTLLFVCYTSRLSGALLAALGRNLLRRSARDLVALLFTLPPKTTILFAAAAPAAASSSAASATAAALASSSSPTKAAAARLAALLGARLKALGDLASEARTIARLWALLGMYAWARRLVTQLFASPSSETTKTTTTNTDRLATAVSWVQLLACTAFQYLENGAYLSGRGVLGWSPREQGRAYVVGARFLAVYTGLEIGKLLAGIVASRQQQGASASSSSSEKGVSAPQTEEEKAQAEAVKRSLAINLAWTPLTLHWATEGGFLSEAAVGFGGCIPGFIQMRKLWRETAQ